MVWRWLLVAEPLALAAVDPLGVEAEYGCAVYGEPGARVGVRWLEICIEWR